MNEQVGLLRRLWTEASVTHHDRFHRITAAGINPLPIQRPIPIWMGGNSTAAFERIGRLADGWFPHRRPGPELESAWATIEAAAIGAGRDPALIGTEGRIGWPRGGPEAAVAQAEGWRAAGATHLAINTIGHGYLDLGEHLAAITAAASALGLVRPRR
jgi:alkanesulfonate monooxygenase SsuD/methylene tetrahydromethanopterin reductase-like flavin-dependent oxidoreductase (luciferase family)